MSGWVAQLHMYVTYVGKRDRSDICTAHGASLAIGVKSGIVFICTIIKSLTFFHINTKPYG